MKSLQFTLAEYLKRRGRMDALVLGPEAETESGNSKASPAGSEGSRSSPAGLTGSLASPAGRRPPERDPNEFLQNALMQHRESNSRCLWFNLALAITGLVLLLLAHFGIPNRTVSNWLMFLAAALILIGFLQFRKCWREKAILDVSIAVVDNLSPEEIAKVIELLYWNVFRTLSR